MRNTNRFVRWLIVGLVVCQSAMPSGVFAGETFARLKRLFAESKYHGTEPCLGKDCAMECLAENIDWLEHHIDTYGSVVAKQPDIWGEARLTKHRDEYERIMFQELGNFDNTLNASISQTDSSFLAQAIALSNAAGTTITPTDPPTGTTVTQVANAKLVNADDLKTTFNRFGITDSTAPDNEQLKLEPVLQLDQQSRYLKHLHEIRRINEGDDTSDSPGYSLNLVRMPVSILPGKLTRQGFGAEVTITAEPVISDDLMPTTFQNLVVNDVVDFLGLPLVRVTERLEAFEAEQEFGPARSIIYKINSLLKNRDFVTLAEPYVQEFFTYETATSQFTLALRSLRAELAPTKSAAPIDSTPSAIAVGKLLATERQKVQEFGQRLNSFLLTDSNIAGTPASIVKEQKNLSQAPRVINGVNPVLTRSAEELRDELFERLIAAIERKDSKETTELVFLVMQGADQNTDADSILTMASGVALSAIANLAEDSTAPAPSGRARRALNPLNPTAIEPVIGRDNLVMVSREFDASYYGTYIRWSGSPANEKCGEHRVNLLDARRFLDAEIKAAYELLSEPEHLYLFANLAAPSSRLASQIRGGHFEGNLAESPGVVAYRHYFFDQLHRHHGAGQLSSMIGSSDLAHCISHDGSLLADISITDQTSVARSATEALAWSIVVESALLNERLNRDVQKLANSKEAFSLQTDQEHSFFLPDTVNRPGFGLEELQSRYQSANEIFKEYVRVRWPIHVFAVDPVAQDQNVADVSQRRRELQFSLALGFASGQIGANSLTQFSRELETQVETVALNRTIVGFGHGHDTFGWRFYPRVQALEAVGTLGAIRETICGTSRDYDLGHRRIEPGQRECVAIVLMPSFVPYADFDVRTDWFKLTNPKNTALTMKDTLKLSRAVTAMRNSRANCANHQHLYRDGELRRLFKRVDQLDRELPLQTQRALVPYENTLGGFEMFNTGVTDLAPELIGWYGAPGINTDPEASKCGCYRGCIPNPELTCDTPANCTTLQEQLKALNATIADSPIPACEGEGTTLFLVGDNFSVHDTKVLAGGVCIPHVRLISRELMQVTIPHCVNTVEICENGQTHKYVALYVSTPYGVTNHLHVPVMSTARPTVACPPTTVQWDHKTTSDTVDTMLASARTRPVIQQASAILANQLPDEGVTESVLRDVTLVEEARDAGLLNLTEQLKKLDQDIERLTELSQGQETRIDVNVNVPRTFAESSRERLCDLDSFPLIKRFKTKAGEQWRNCRDQLPCN